jgi:hypothetical protein
VIGSHGDRCTAGPNTSGHLERRPWPASPNASVRLEGDLEIVRRLVERGDDIAARAEDNDLTVLDRARRGGHETVIDYLMSIGAPESERWPTGDSELCR